MPGSTTSLFPDINVWVALTYEGHAHHRTAASWFATLKPDMSLVFCRLTQLGLLRLLTTDAVMGDEVMTQPQAWAAYDRWHGRTLPAHRGDRGAAETAEGVLARGRRDGPRPG